MRICHICESSVGEYEPCRMCMERFGRMSDVDGFTVEQRADELELLRGVLEIPMIMLHERITRLVGRPVWTHELAHPEQLIAEILSGQKATFDDVLAKVPEGKTLILKIGP